MIKRFAYIVLLLVLAPCLLLANITIKNNLHVATMLHPVTGNVVPMSGDTSAAKKLKQQQEEEKKKLEDEKKKVKEIGKAKRQTKPEKVDEKAKPEVKPKRERRPEGMERPPEIPRRNGN